jgi:GNAT superfamily N-acetyltransferase
VRRRRHRGRARRQGRSLIEVHPIGAARARTIRWPVLRPGRPEQDAWFPEDEQPGTVHLGAFEDERLVGVATFFPDPCPGHEDVLAWRLRGMAALPDARGRGVGRLLVERGFTAARKAGAALVWCNGRLDAAGFYLKLGFAIDGGIFDPHGTGPHHRFVRRIDNIEAVCQKAE